MDRKFFWAAMITRKAVWFQVLGLSEANFRIFHAIARDQFYSSAILVGDFR